MKRRYKRIAQFNRYYKCNNCGWVFRLKRFPGGKKIYCPICGSDNIVESDKKEFDKVRGEKKVRSVM